CDGNPFRACRHVWRLRRGGGGWESEPVGCQEWGVGHETGRNCHSRLPTSGPGFIMILRALVLRPIRREVMRTALTILGIAVGVAVVVAIALSNQSALRAFQESVD